MEAIKVIAGGIIGLGSISIRWAYRTRETRAMRLAREHQLSMLRVVPPYDRFGISGRCELWTLYGAFIGGLVGLGIGWAYLDSVALGVLLAIAAGALGAWRYRVVTSILVATEGRPPPAPSTPRRVAVKGGRVYWATLGALCGVIATVSVGPIFDQHGTTLLGEMVAACVWVAWGFVKIRDRLASAGSTPSGPRQW